MIDRTLDPNTFYTAHDLYLRLGIAWDVTERARSNGRLQAVDLRPRNGRTLLPDNRSTATRGEEFLYKGSAVLAWLAEGAPTEATAPTRRAAAGPDANQQRSPTGNIRDPAPEQPWQRAVAAKVATGMTRSAAVLAVERENPQLRQQYLEDYNARHRQPAAA